MDAGLLHGHCMTVTGRLAAEPSSVGAFEASKGLARAFVC